MKVCIVTAYYSPIRGGITTYITNLSRALRKRENTEVEIITRFGDRGVNVFPMSQNRVLFVLHTFFFLLRTRADVLHSQGSWYLLLPCVAYKMIHPKTRVICTFHTDPAKSLEGYKKYIFGWIISRCDYATFVSKFLLDKINQNIKICCKTKVVYAGVSDKKIEDEEVKKFMDKFSLNDKKPVISFVGGLVWEKKVDGVKELVKAFSVVTEEYPKARLLIVGGGPYQKEIEELVNELKISENVIITGFLEDVFTPLALTDIYAHISLQEGLPLAILEAMIMKKPVIASSVGGIPEVIEDGRTGILLEVDYKLISDSIVKLYKDKKKMMELGQNAYMEVIRKYSWDKTANEFLELYKIKDDN